MTRTFAIILTIALASPALARPFPYPKTGQCSGGYVQSGSYCVPKTEQSQPAVPKVGQCPCDGGWDSRQSGRCPYLQWPGHHARVPRDPEVRATRSPHGRDRRPGCSRQDKRCAREEKH
jgi:hypothetical protein